MVKFRAATVASVVVLLATLSATLANDSWGDTAQYSNDPVTQEQQSTDAPVWDATKKDEKTESSKNDPKSYDFQKADDDQKSDDQNSNDDATDAPTNSWTPAPQDSSGNNWSQTLASSWESSRKSEDNNDQDDKSDTSPSSGDEQNPLTPAPTTSESSGTSGGDNNEDNDTGESSESTETSESNGDSWKQEPVTSSEGSQTSGGTTPSTGSQTTGGGGGSSTPSSGGGKVPDGTWPTSTGSVKFTAPHVIKAGEVFDGKMQTFDRSDITCSEGEGQKDTAVFLVEAGGTLKNAIIGKHQKEGVHCDKHDCTIENVWWDDVCEDALSIKGGTASSVTTVTNCGARSASDKVVQHNGQGTVNIDGFYAENFGKLYRSCGTCGDILRKVTVRNVYAVDPHVSVITVNKNYGDEAILSNIWVKTSDSSNDVKVCEWSQGGDIPSNLGDGPSPTLCEYSESDIHINQDISQAGGSPPTTPTKSTDGSSTSQTEWTSPTESSGNGDGGDDETTDAPVPSSAGSQTSQEPVPTSESSGNDDEDGNSTSQNQLTQPSSSSSKTSEDNNNDDGGDNGTTDAPSTSWGGGNKEAPSKSSDDNNGDDMKEKGSSKTDEKSDDNNSDPTQQEETTPDDQSVMQSDVAGEAEMDVDPATKQATKMKKCNVHRRNRD